MQLYKSLLSVFGLLLIVIGVLLNALMFIQNAWPTYLYFIFIAVGIVLIIIDIPIRKTNRISFKNKLSIQILIITLPILAIYLKTQVIDSRAKVVIAPPNFKGPYIILFGVNGKPKLPKQGRDVIIKLPESRVVVTSTKMVDLPNLLQTYISDKDKDKYGREVFTDLTSTGRKLNSKCSFAIDYQVGYYGASGDLTAKELEMDLFIRQVYDSLCNENQINPKVKR